MSFYEISALSAGIFHLLLTIFVTSRGLRGNITRAYMVWGVSLTVWNLSTYFKFAVRNEGYEEQKFWLEMLHLGVVFLPASILHLTFLIARIRHMWIVKAAYIVFSLIAVTIFTSLYIRDIRATTFGPVVVGGPTFSIYTKLYMATALTTIGLLWVRQRKEEKLHRTRLRALLLAYITLVAFGTHDLLLPMGLKQYPVLEIPVIPLGNLAAIFFGAVVAYSVLQHQLLDVHVTLGRIAAQMVRILFMFLVGFLLMLVAYTAFPGQINAFSFFVSLAALLATGILTSLLFPRLFGKGEERLERRILGDRFEYQARMQGFIQSIPQYSNVPQLLDDVNDHLVGTLKVASFQIILLDEKTKAFTLLRSFPPMMKKEVPDLRIQAPLFEYFHQSQEPYLALNLGYAVPGESALERSARQQLRLFGEEFCFPLITGEEVFGLFLLGEKTNGEPYTAYDLILLTNLVKNLSLVINQIRMKNQVLQSQELELLGRMSQGMAHDLNNLVTPIYTYLQLAKADLINDETNHELLPMASRNVETIQSYIREALFFAQYHTLQIADTQLDQLMEKVIEIAKPKFQKKGITIVQNYTKEIRAEIDEVLILRLINNLLTNAIDASPPGSTIWIEIEQLTPTERHREWIRIQVIDEGEGISEENLKRIATPYFTTKDKGDEMRGFGLGLAICRKIVHLHGGNLNILSKEQSGTTVQVDLPTHAPAASKPEETEAAIP